MSSASLSSRVSLVPAVNQAATQTCKLHPLNLQSTLPAAVAMVLLDAALAISPQSLSSQSQNDFADAHGLGMPVDPKAGSASGLKRSRDEEKDFDSEVGIPGRHGVGKSPCEEPEKQIKNSKHARRRTETPHIHECIPCGKAFATSSALTKHILVHSGDKPYSCGLCGKASARADSFTVHLRVHRRGQ